VLYAAYDTMSGMAERWDLEPGLAALARGCFGILRPEGREYLEQWRAIRWCEFWASASERLPKTSLLNKRSDVSASFMKRKSTSPLAFR
jgi:hypothetical protein